MKKASRSRLARLSALVIVAVLVVAALAAIAAVSPSRLAGLRRMALGAMGIKLRKVTIPEGFNRVQVAGRLEAEGIVAAQDFLVVTEDRPSLARLGIDAPTAEGFLFPDTYQFFAGGAPSAMLAAMVKNFRAHLADAQRRFPLWEKRLAPLGGDPAAAALVLASLVQLEAQKREEMPVIAGVFMNRLLDPSFSPRLLQSDPSVKYGCVALDPPSHACEKFEGRLDKSTLRDAENPYNTYVFPGLPPGPVCNPGTAAIEAALAPAATSYFYFVAKGDGTHQFSATLAEHNEAVGRYRKHW